MQSPPAATVPPNWVHPDLKRQMMDRRRRAATARIETLESYNVSLNTCALETGDELHEKRQNLVALEKRVQHLKSDIASLEADEAEVSSALEGIVTQLSYHRNKVGELRASANSRSQCYEVLAGEEVAHAPQEPFTVNLEPFFGHLLWRPFACFTLSPCDHTRIAHFLREFAPLFVWDSPNATVRPATVLDKPCLMETDSVPCPSASCTYWHRDQLQHVRSSLLALETATAAFHIHDQRLDCVAELLATWRTTLRRTRTLEEVNSCTAHVLRTIIGHGWHTGFCDARESAWKAPVLSRAPLQDEDGNTSQGTSCGGQQHPLTVDMLHNAAERECWRAVLECAELSIPAAQLFVDTPDAILWRCMIRASAHTQAQRLWLARRGIEVYPGSPHLQLHYVFALIDTGASPKTCLDACLQAVAALSAQTCAAAVIPGKAAVAAAATVARYTAFLIARCALHLANSTTTSTTTTSAEASEPPSESGPDYAEVLLTTVLQHDGQDAALLPTATVNLTLMLISLKQMHSLPHMDVLPLGSISDQVFTFTKVTRSRAQDGCTQRLNGLLALLSSLRRHEMDAPLIATLKAAVQLSLERTFAIQLHFVEQIVRKSSVGADIVLAALWGEYVRCAAQLDSTEASTRLARDLLEACESAPPCVLTWVLIEHLAVCGDTKAHAAIAEAASKACTHFEATYPGIAQARSEHNEEEDEEDESHTEARTLSMPDPVELAAYHVLRAQGLMQTADRAAYLERVVIRPLVASCDALSLLLLAQLKLSAIAENMDDFRRVLRDRLTQVREAHLLWWSPLDVWYDEVVGTPHMVSLLVYRAVPALVGPHAEATTTFREAVLDVAAELGVLHPLLYR